MTKLTLTNHVQTNTTILENEFIDKHMANANGEYVKVYLFLLRHLNDPAGVPKISEIADALDYTEKDVIRALNYGETRGYWTMKYVLRIRQPFLLPRFLYQTYPTLSGSGHARSSEKYFM